MPVPTPQQLAAVDLFRGLPAPELAQASAHMHARRWPAGHCFVSYRDESRDVYAILSGRVRVKIYSEAGREVSFRDLEAGQSFGELSAIDQEPRSTDVIALTDVEVASVPPGEFMALLARHPAMAVATMRKLTMLVRSLSERVAEFSEPVPIRICKELLRLAEAATTDRQTARLCPAPKHADIAARCNTHREAVTRLLGSLDRAGVLRREEGHRAITIRTIPGLRAYAQRLIDQA